MGRKNRNARRRGVRTYTSFEDLKNQTVEFDLSTANFSKRTNGHGQRCNQNAEVRVSIRTEGPGTCRERNVASISFRKDIAKEIEEHCGNFLTTGIVRNGNFERMYIIGDKDGFAMTISNKSKTTRHTVIIPIGEQKSYFEKYNGEHEMQYDDVNDEYYVTASR